MTNPGRRAFKLLHGVISDLVVERVEQDFLREQSDRVAASGAAAGLAMAGMAGAASGALLASSGSADPVECFTATIAGIHVAGRFSRVGFKNGDEVDMVVEPMNDGSSAAFAVRRLSDHTIWMYPHCSRGSRAHWKHALRMIPVVFLALGLLLSTFFLLADYFYDDPTPGGFYLVIAILVSVNSLIASLYLPIKIARKWKPFVELAEQIFATLGYDEPSCVDLERENRIFCRRHRTEVGRVYAPWVFQTLK